MYDIDYTNGSYWTYSTLLSQNLRFMHYGGDLDSLTSVSSLQHWVRLLEADAMLATDVPWRPWLTDGNRPGEPQLGGFYKRLQPNFEYLTVRGGGHQLLQSHPKLVNEILDGFLDGRTFV